MASITELDHRVSHFNQKIAQAERKRKAAEDTKTAAWIGLLVVSGEEATLGLGAQMYLSESRRREAKREARKARIKRERARIKKEALQQKLHLKLQKTEQKRETGIQRVVTNSEKAKRFWKEKYL